MTRSNSFQHYALGSVECNHSILINQPLLIYIRPCMYAWYELSLRPIRSSLSTRSFSTSCRFPCRKIEKTLERGYISQLTFPQPILLVSVSSVTRLYTVPKYRLLYIRIPFESIPLCILHSRGLLQSRTGITQDCNRFAHRILFPG